ncbi:hypothetical protein PQX77_010186 [Marasmius sp. AFHP31]|nr:hypothetical protein PQX77_010186 [Marasmius sp. AFHP31]
MTLSTTSQTDAENLRQCSNPQCTPPLTHEPRCGSEPQVGDIICIRMSALAPFYNLLGDTADRGCKPGDRPCIITAMKNVGTFTVCLMATFDKNSYEELPAIFKEFIVHVPTTNPSDNASLNTRLRRHVHTTPEWTIPGSGVCGSQYLIVLPIIVSSKPFKKWRTPDMPSDAGFFVDETTMSKLDVIIYEHDNRSQEWLRENGSLKASSMLQALRGLEKTYKSRDRAAEDDRATLLENLVDERKEERGTFSAKGGTKDVDGFTIVGPDGKEAKPKSRRSRVPSSRAPSNIASTYTPRRVFGPVS